MAASSTRPQPPALPSPIRSMLERAIEGGTVELPLLPDAAMQVMEACNDEKADAGYLSEILGRNQAFASHVLRISNSAAYAPKEPIVSLRQAVSRLGVATISEIAISIAVKGRVFRVPGHQAEIRKLWMHSAAAAVYAKMVAEQTNAEGESAFMCGLLHDVGKPMVMQALIDEVSVRTKTPIPQLVMDSAVAEFHCRVGAEMAHKWGLPEWIVEAISHHHAYAEAKVFPGKAMIAALANELVHWALDDDRSEADFPAELPVIQDLNLTGKDVMELLEKRGRVLEVIEAFM